MSPLESLDPLIFLPISNQYFLRHTTPDFVRFCGIKVILNGSGDTCSKSDRYEQTLVRFRGKKKLGLIIFPFSGHIMCTKSRVGFQSNKWESSLVRPLQLFKIPSYTPSLWSICVFHRKANGLLLLHFKNTQKRRTKARRPPHNNPFLNWNIFSKASWEVPTPTPSPNGVSDAAMSRNRCRHHQSLTFNVFNLSWTLCIQCWEGHRLYFWSFLSNWESLLPMITFHGVAVDIAIFTMENKIYGGIAR